MNTIAAPLSNAHERPSRLFLGINLLLAAIAVLGFTPTYWAPLGTGTLTLPPVYHLHGLLFTAWMALAVVQAALVARGRTTSHRELGLVGIALAALMVFSGVLVQVVQTRALLAGPRPEIAPGVTALSLSAMVMFSTFVALGIANVRRPAVHRRLMVMASFAIIGAAVARPFRFLPGTTPADRGLMAAVLVDAILLMVIWLDRRETGRIHPVWLAGGAFLLLNQAGRALIGRTEAWATVTEWVARLGG